MNDSYADPPVIVSTDWVANHLTDPSVVIVEVNTDLDSTYRRGHVPRALGWGLHTDLEDQVRRDVPGVRQMSEAESLQQPLRPAPARGGRGRALRLRRRPNSPPAPVRRPP